MAKKYLDLNGLKTFWSNVNNKKRDQIPITKHGNNEIEVTIAPNEYHIWGVMDELVIRLDAPENSSIYNEYLFEFVSGDEPTTLILPKDIIWQGSVEIESNKTYQVSVANGVGVIIGVDGVFIDYLKFTAEEDSTISLPTNTSPNLLYSLNAIDWNEWDYSELSIPAGQTVYMKGTNSSFSTSDAAYNQFAMTGKIKAHGNIMSLLFGDDILAAKDLTGYNYVFYNLFSGCSSLTTAPELPAMTLADFCYYNLFSGCSSLTTAPELPATTLTNRCYSYMFNECSSLIEAPELPAMTLAPNCYYGMFQKCSSLTKASELPAMTLAESCYRDMFQSCSKLTAAPELPAMTLAPYCYQNMFNNCSSLTTAP